MKKVILWGAVVVVILAGGWWLSRPWLPYHDPHLASGVKVRLLEGSVRRPGPLAFQMALPAHFVFPPHFHDVDEELRIISGTLFLGGMDGTAFDCARGDRFPPGTVHRLPASMHHWGFTTDSPVVVEVRSQGPYTLHWIPTGPLHPCT